MHRSRAQAGIQTWVRATSLGTALAFTYVNVIYGAIEPLRQAQGGESLDSARDGEPAEPRSRTAAKSFWQERKDFRQALKEDDSQSSNRSAQVPLPAQNQATLLAQLPTINPNVLPQNLPLNVPALPNGVLPESLSTPEGVRNLEKLPKWMGGVGSKYATLRDLYLPEGWKPGDLMVVHVQDAHGNAEAQRNIAKVLESLYQTEVPPGHSTTFPSAPGRSQAVYPPERQAVDVTGNRSPVTGYPRIVVGVEGGRGEFNFGAYRRFPEAEITRAIADYFLKETLISGPEYVGLTLGLGKTVTSDQWPVTGNGKVDGNGQDKHRSSSSEERSDESRSDNQAVDSSRHQPLDTSHQSEPPMDFWGVEDEGLYLSHVKALKDSILSQEKAKEALKRVEEGVEGLKGEIFHPALRDLEEKISLHRQGRIGLGAYVKALVKQGSSGKKRKAEWAKATNLFLQALEMEGGLKYDRVEEERAALTRALTENLPKSELKNLVQASLAYRLGQIRHGAFYEYLQDLCRAYRVDLKQWPEMQKYILYVGVSEKIKAEELFGELERMEEEALKVEVKTPEESELLSVSRDLGLVGKLIGYALSPEEWDQYDKRRGEIYRIGERIEKLVTSDQYPVTSNGKVKVNGKDKNRSSSSAVDKQSREVMAGSRSFDNAQDRLALNSTARSNSKNVGFLVSPRSVDVTSPLASSTSRQAVDSSGYRLPVTGYRAVDVSDRLPLTAYRSLISFLAPFEQFNQAALKRNDAILNNFLARVAEDSASPGSSFPLQRDSNNNSFYSSSSIEHRVSRSYSLPVQSVKVKVDKLTTLSNGKPDMLSLKIKLGTPDGTRSVLAVAQAKNSKEQLEMQDAPVIEMPFQDYMIRLYPPHQTKVGKALESAWDKISSPLQMLNGLLPETSDQYAVTGNGNRAVDVPDRFPVGAGKSSTCVLVTGGFHTKGMTEILKSKKIAYAVLMPRLGNVEGEGTEYLDVFTRDKTPLEKLFTAERITLNPEPNFMDRFLSALASHFAVPSLWFAMLSAGKATQAATQGVPEDQIAASAALAVPAFESDSVPLGTRVAALGKTLVSRVQSRFSSWRTGSNASRDNQVRPLPAANPASILDRPVRWTAQAIADIVTPVARNILPKIGNRKDRVRAEIAQLEKLLHDKNFAFEMGKHLHDAYNNGTSQALSNFIDERDDQNVITLKPQDRLVAINLAGFYAVECGIGIISERTQEKPSEILSRVVNGKLADDEMRLMVSLARATWMAGQPFKSLDRIERPQFSFVENVNSNDWDTSRILIETAAKEMLNSIEPGLDRNAQVDKLHDLLKDAYYSDGIARKLRVAYQAANQGKEHEPEAIVTNLRDQKIAISLAGLYALLMGAEYIAYKNNSTPFDVLQSIKDKSIKKSDLLLLARFANATWKPGQPFRSIERIKRDTFRPAILLTEEELEKDFVQIEAAAEKVNEKVDAAVSKSIENILYGLLTVMAVPWGETLGLQGALGVAAQIFGPLVLLDPTGISWTALAAISVISLIFSLLHADLYEGIGVEVGKQSGLLKKVKSGLRFIVRAWFRNWKLVGVRFLGGFAFTALLTLPGGFWWSFGLHALLNFGIITDLFVKLRLPLLNRIRRPFDSVLGSATTAPTASPFLNKVLVFTNNGTEPFVMEPMGRGQTWSPLEGDYPLPPMPTREQVDELVKRIDSIRAKRGLTTRFFKDGVETDAIRRRGRSGRVGFRPARLIRELVQRGDTLAIEDVILNLRLETSGKSEAERQEIFEEIREAVKTLSFAGWFVEAPIGIGDISVYPNGMDKRLARNYLLRAGFQVISIGDAFGWANDDVLLADIPEGAHFFGLSVDPKPDAPYHEARERAPHIGGGVRATEDFFEKLLAAKKTDLTNLRALKLALEQSLTNAIETKLTRDFAKNHPTEPTPNRERAELIRTQAQAQAKDIADRLTKDWTEDQPIAFALDVDMTLNEEDGQPITPKIGQQLKDLSVEGFQIAINTSKEQNRLGKNQILLPIPSLQAADALPAASPAMRNRQATTPGFQIDAVIEVEGKRFWITHQKSFEHGIYWLGIDISNGRQVLISPIRSKTQNEDARYQNMKKIRDLNLRHTDFIALGETSDGTRLCVTPYYENFLFSYYKALSATDRQNKLSESLKNARELGEDLLLLEEIHLPHNDLHEQNVYVDATGNWQIKDFADPSDLNDLVGLAQLICVSLTGTTPQWLRRAWMVHNLREQEAMDIFNKSLRETEAPQISENLKAGIVKAALEIEGFTLANLVQLIREEHELTLRGTTRTPAFGLDAWMKSKLGEHSPLYLLSVLFFGPLIETTLPLAIVKALEQFHLADPSGLSALALGGACLAVALIWTVYHYALNDCLPEAYAPKDLENGKIKRDALLRRLGKRALEGIGFTLPFALGPANGFWLSAGLHVGYNLVSVITGWYSPAAATPRLTRREFLVGAVLAFLAAIVAAISAAFSRTETPPAIPAPSAVGAPPTVAINPVDDFIMKKVIFLGKYSDEEMGYFRELVRSSLEALPGPYQSVVFNNVTAVFFPEMAEFQSAQTNHRDLYFNSLFYGKNQEAEGSAFHAYSAALGDAFDRLDENQKRNFLTADFTSVLMHESVHALQAGGMPNPNDLINAIGNFRPGSLPEVLARSSFQPSGDLQARAIREAEAYLFEAAVKSDMAKDARFADPFIWLARHLSDPDGEDVPFSGALARLFHENETGNARTQSLFPSITMEMKRTEDASPTEKIEFREIEIKEGEAPHIYEVSLSLRRGGKPETITFTLSDQEPFSSRRFPKEPGGIGLSWLGAHISALTVQTGTRSKTKTYSFGDAWAGFRAAFQQARIVPLATPQTQVRVIRFYIRHDLGLPSEGDIRVAASFLEMERFLFHPRAFRRDHPSPSLFLTLSLWTIWAFSWLSLPLNLLIALNVPGTFLILFYINPMTAIFFLHALYGIFTLPFSGDKDFKDVLVRDFLDRLGRNREGYFEGRADPGKQDFIDRIVEKAQARVPQLFRAQAPAPIDASKPNGFRPVTYESLHEAAGDILLLPEVQNAVSLESKLSLMMSDLRLRNIGDRPAFQSFRMAVLARTFGYRARRDRPNKRIGWIPDRAVIDRLLPYLSLEEMESLVDRGQWSSGDHRANVGTWTYKQALAYGMRASRNADGQWVDITGMTQEEFLSVLEHQARLHLRKVEFNDAMKHAILEVIAEGNRLKTAIEGAAQGKEEATGWKLQSEEAAVSLEGFHANLFDLSCLNAEPNIEMMANQIVRASELREKGKISELVIPIMTNQYVDRKQFQDSVISQVQDELKKKLGASADVVPLMKAAHLGEIVITGQDLARIRPKDRARRVGPTLDVDMDDLKELLMKELGRIKLDASKYEFGLFTDNFLRFRKGASRFDVWLIATATQVVQVTTTFETQLRERIVALMQQ